MKKEFVPYEQALELKELGFDEECLAWTIPNETNFIISPCEKYGERFDKMVQIPTFSQVFRWFREKYKVEGYINLNDSKENNFHYYFNYINTNNIHNRREYCNFFIGNFKTYEEAELECLKKLIEIVKDGK